jgi:hypothetical protein
MKDHLIKGNRAGSNWLRKSGTVLDLEKGLYMQFESILGLVSGIWKTLPSSDYILIFKTMYVKCEDCNLEDFEKDFKGYYQISLVYKQRRLIVHESKNKEEVFDLANKLSALMNLPVRDSASDRRQPKWLNRKVA